MTDRLSQISSDLRRRIERNPELNRRVAELNEGGFVTVATLALFMSQPTKKLIPADLRIRTIFAADPDDVMSGENAKKEVLSLIQPIEDRAIAKLRQIASEKERRKYNL